VNYLALIGWSPGGGDELLPLDELARRFSLGGVSRSAGVFDEEKLAWANRHYLKLAEPVRLAALVVRYLRRAGLATEPSPAAIAWLASVMPMVSGAVDRLDQAPDRLRLVFSGNVAAALAREEVRAEFAPDAARGVVRALAEISRAPAGSSIARPSGLQPSACAIAPERKAVACSIRFASRSRARPMAPSWTCSCPRSTARPSSSRPRASRRSPAAASARLPFPPRWVRRAECR
jgi:hypothetical protein